MSDDVQVKFGADVTEMKTNVENLAQSVDKSTKKMENDTKAAMTAMESAIVGAEAAMKSLAVAFAPIIAAMSVIKVIEVASSFEQLEIRLNAVMGSAQAGERAFDWIKKFAVDTPYTVQQTTDAFMQLKNFGLDPMDGTLQKIADASAKYGKGADTAARVTLALGQAWARGKLQGQDTLQMIDAGIPVYELLSKATGKTAAEIQNMSEKGTMGHDVMRKLIDQMGKEGAGVAAEKMKTFSGAVSNMGDAFENAIDRLRKQGGFDFLTQSILKFTEVIPALVESAGNIASNVGEAFMSLYGIVKEAFGEIFDVIQSVFGKDSKPMTGMDAFKGALKAIGTVVVLFRVGLQEAFEAIRVSVLILAHAFTTFSDVANKAFHRDLSGAKEAWISHTKESEKIVADSAKRILDIAAKGQADLDAALYGKAEKQYETKGGFNKGGKKVDNSSNTGKEKVDKGTMQALEAELAIKRIEMLEQQHREITRAEEDAFWKEKLSKAAKNGKDYIEITKKLAVSHIADLKEGIAQEKAMDKMALDEKKAIDLNQIAIKELQTKADVDAKKITRLQELEMIKVFEAQKFAIEMQYSKEKSKLLDKDKVDLQKSLDEQAAIERKYVLEKAKIEADVQKAIADEAAKNAEEMKKFADTAAKNIQSAFASFLFDPFKNGTQGMLQQFGDMLRKMAAEAAAAELMKKMFPGKDGMSGAIESIMGSIGMSSGGGGSVAGVAGASGGFDFGSIFSSFLGGGREQGGYTSKGVVYQVGEGNKPEIFKSGGKQYMISGDNGAVISNKDIRGNSGDTTHNMNITVNSSSGNPDEIRRAVGQASREAMAQLQAADRYK